MKLLLFDEYRLGVVHEGRVVDASHVFDGVGPISPALRMEHVIAFWDAHRPQLEDLAQRPGVPLEDVRVRPPLPRPHSILCAFANYLDSPGATRRDLDFFYKGNGCVAGDGDTLVVPDVEGASAFQPEAELGYVIGREARNVAEAEALDHVFGYINFVDGSLRGVPNRRTTFIMKGGEGWAPMGPFIVTRDEVADPQNLNVKLWKNGELQQDYSTADMAYSVAEQIAWLSKHVTLRPGDVVSCGTHHQGLCNVNDGDTFEQQIEDFGRLRLSVKSYAPRMDEVWHPPYMKS